MLQRPIRRPARGYLLLLVALILGATACSILRPSPALPAGAGGAVGWVLLNLAGRAGLAPFALPGWRWRPLRWSRSSGVDHRAVAGRLARSGQRRRPPGGPACPRLGARHGGGDGIRPALHSALARAAARAADGGDRPPAPVAGRSRMAAATPPRLARVTALPGAEPQLGRGGVPAAAARPQGDAGETGALPGAVPEAVTGAVTARLVRLVMPRAKPGLPGRRGEQELQPALDLAPDDEPLLPPLSPLTKPPSRRSHAGHDEIAPLHMRVRRVRAEARAARVPPEVVQLVAGVGHFDTRDLSAVAWRCGIDVQHSKGVVGGRVGIEQRHVGKRFRRGLHGHRRRRVKALVGKQFRHCLALLAVSVRAIQRLESSGRRRPLRTLAYF